MACAASGALEAQHRVVLGHPAHAGQSKPGVPRQRLELFLSADPQPGVALAQLAVEARDLLRRLMGEATHAAFGTVHPDHGAPHVTRIALAMTKQD